jgi:hypothetical protein
VRWISSLRNFSRALFIPSFTMATLMLLGTAALAAQTNDECTPTPTVASDLPGVNWHDSQKQIRDQYPYPEHKEYSAREIESLIVRPTSATELFQNFKVAFDRQLIVQRHFFETRVLTKFFNAYSVEWAESRNQYEIDKRGIVKVKQGPLLGYQISLRLELAGLSNGMARNPDHLLHVGHLDALSDGSALPIKIKTVINIFGPPPFTYRGACIDDSEPDPRCKGIVSYDNAPTAPNIGGDRFDLDVRSESPERFFAGWRGRQRFLCNEDELRSIRLQEAY